MALHQTIAKATGVLTTWTVKAGVNMIARHIDLHLSLDTEECVPCLTIHARMNIFGLSGHWFTMQRARLDGKTVYALPIGLGVVHSLVKSCPRSLAFTSFWVHERPYQELYKASCEAGEDQLLKPPHLETGGRASQTRSSEVGCDGISGLASMSPFHSIIPERQGVSFDKLYVQHARTAEFDECTQTVGMHGFLPGKGVYHFRLRKIAPADDAVPRLGPDCL